MFAKCQSCGIVEVTVVPGIPRREYCTKCGAVTSETVKDIMPDGVYPVKRNERMIHAVVAAHYAGYGR